MAENQKQDVVVAGPYKESDTHVPSPTDMTGTLNTTGVGGPQNLAAVAPAVEIDKQKVARDIVNGDADVMYAGSTEDHAPSEEDQQSSLEEVAQKRLDEGPVELGGPTEAEEKAGETKDEDADKATEDKAGQSKAKTSTAAKTSATKG